MNDIRSALAAAMHSQGEPRIEDIEPVEVANDERIEVNAAQPERNIHRPGRRGGEAVGSSQQRGHLRTGTGRWQRRDWATEIRTSEPRGAAQLEAFRSGSLQSAARIRAG